MIYFRKYTYHNECWWCKSDDLSREHKYKKSELVREYGGCRYKKNVIIAGNGKKDMWFKGPNCLEAKFKPNLCKKCNNSDSRDIDIAYDVFQKYLKSNIAELTNNRCLDLNNIFAADVNKNKMNLIRYLVKHVCCRLAEANIYIEDEVVSFLNGGYLLPYITFRFEIAIDAYRMHQKISSLNEKSHFSLGGMQCISNKTSNRARNINSYFQYRWFRISYLCDMSIKPLDIMNLNDKIPLILNFNANSYFSLM